MMTILIREEQFGDEAAIFKITEDAFRGKPYAGGDEQILVDRLRAQKALVLSLVAVDDDKQADASRAEKTVVGHIAFSIAINTDGSAPWFAFGPVSVAPERQAKGIGTQLINQGLETIQSWGALGCILTGDPNYYSRFGFAVSPDFSPANEPAEYFQLKLLSNATPTGTFSFHPAFYE